MKHPPTKHPPTSSHTGQVVDNLITQLLEKIPFLAPSSPTPAPPSGIGGLVSNLVGSVTGGASNIIKVCGVEWLGGCCFISTVLYT